jgi:serine/threonine-protein kinase
MHSQQVLNGRYRLIEVLGSGGMANVWRAKDEVLNRTVAIKVLAGPDADDPVVRRHMLREAQAAAALAHPNLINVHDYGEYLGPDGVPLPFLVMELLTGQTLAEPGVAESLSPDQAIAVCAQIANALAALHRHGLAHRDIKPSNVMLTADGVKVIDFGIAANTGAPEAGGSDIFGTPSYLAPERLVGGDVTAASDVYALGVLIYWLLARELPWPAGSSADAIQAHLSVHPAPLPSIEDVPPQVADICLRCLEKDPDRRPTAAAVGTALTSAAQQAALNRDIASWWAAQPTTQADGAGQTSRRRRRPLILALSGLVSVLLVMLALLPAIAARNGASGMELAEPSTTPGRLPSPPGVIATEPATVGQPGATTIVTTQVVPVPGAPGAFRTQLVTSQITLPPTTIISTATQPTSDTPAEPPPPPGLPVVAIGGTATIRCQGATATILSTEPAPGFSVTDRHFGAATQVGVVFTSATHQSEIIARCGPRGLNPTVKETPLPPA